MEAHRWFLQVLQMTFGDWELFKAAVVTLREVERGNLHLTSPVEETAGTGSGAKIPRNSSGKDLARIIVTSPQSPPDRAGAFTFIEMKTLGHFHVTQQYITLVLFLMLVYSFEITKRGLQ